ncbi:MAG: hypothetical protein WC640_00890 [Candidatus Paceibacterota bacterium]|jgi:hypothetical protein
MKDDEIKNIPTMKELELNAKSFERSKFPQSARALTIYSLKLQYLSNSINLCKETEDYYSLCVLFRSSLEHYFRHLYIFSRALGENSDEVGAEYYGKLKGHEDLCFLRSSFSLNTKLNGEKSTFSLKGEGNDNLDDVAKNFKINNILSYLNKGIGEDKEIQTISKDFFNKYSRDYSTLSSFVHGGPYAEKYMEMYSKDNDGKQKDIKYLASESDLLTNKARRNTSLFIEITTNKD